MANDDTRPMNDADIGGEIAGGDQPAGGAPLKAQGDDLSPTTDFGAGDTAPGDAAAGGDQAPASKVEQVKQAARENASKYGQQATDKVRQFADDGKSRAGGALDQLSQMLTDAAGQVDDKLGAQYGQYARQAATTVQGFSDQVKNKDIDELVEDIRGFVRKSPAVAVGAAAAVGFVVARLVQAGLDDDKA